MAGHLRQVILYLVCHAIWHLCLLPLIENTSRYINICSIAHSKKIVISLLISEMNLKLFYFILQGGIGHIEAEPVDHMPNPSENFFDTLNEKAASIGIPRWNLGPYVVEPIISVGFIILLLLIGIHGLLFGILLFVICKWSNSGGGPGAGWQGWMGGNMGGRDGGDNDGGGGAGGGGGGRGARGWSSGGGQRLGRS